MWEGGSGSEGGIGSRVARRCTVARMESQAGQTAPGHKGNTQPGLEVVHGARLLGWRHK